MSHEAKVVVAEVVSPTDVRRYNPNSGHNSGHCSSKSSKAQGACKDGEVNYIEFMPSSYDAVKDYSIPNLHFR